MRHFTCSVILLSSLVVLPVIAGPIRPLHQPTDRPLPATPIRHVDATRGDDANDGSRDKPFKSLAAATVNLQPGDTVVLRGGVYYGHTVLAARGAADQPIIVRSWPGETAILDGGISDFAISPEYAWEPCPDGAPGEYRSTKNHANLNSGRGGDADGDGASHVFGNFAETMIPLQAYRLRGDLQSDNPYWTIQNKVGDESFVYCGPGIWYDAETGRVHCRLQHTKVAAFGEQNYRGSTDPRQVKLVVAGSRDRSPLTLDGARYVILQDLVIRGAAGPTLLIQNSRAIELDRLTVYGGASCVTARSTCGLRMSHTALRGIAAPWTFRGSLKYRSVESRLFSSGSWSPTGDDGSDFEFAYCEFTDSVDGVFFGNVRRVRIHHSLLDNVTDDGFFCTAATAYDGETPGGDVRVYQNRLARTLTTFAFGVGHGRQKMTDRGRQTGSGIHICRNVFDFREPLNYYWPKADNDPLGIHSLGRFAGDHGSPTWEPMWIYHNTFLAGDTPRYDYLTGGVGTGIARGTSRRVFNNISLQKLGSPGNTLPKAEADFAGDGNLYWTADPDAQAKGDPLAKARKSPAVAQSRTSYPPGWSASDLWVDPKLMAYSTDPRGATDVRLAAGSPAIDSGVAIPVEWPDPLRAVDAGAPDRGAIPVGTKTWRVGVNGRMTVDGRPVVAAPTPSVHWDLSWTNLPTRPAPPAGAARAAIYTGYPAFDEPILSCLLRKQGSAVEVFERTFPVVDDFAHYDFVAIDGGMARAKLDKTTFTDADLPKVRAFLERGGTLLLMRDRTDLFADDAGKAFLKEIGLERGKPLPPRASDQPDAALSPLRIKVGKGQVVYVGWSPAGDMPHGREKSTVEMEETFLKQVRLMAEVVTGN